jgi:signal transduction histidine kinase
VRWAAKGGNMTRSEITELGLKLIAIFNFVNIVTVLPNLFYYFQSESTLFIVIFIAITLVILLIFWNSIKPISKFIWREETSNKVVLNINAKLFTQILISGLGLYFALVTFPSLLGSIASVFQNNSIYGNQYNDYQYKYVFELIGRIIVFSIGIIMTIKMNRIVEYICRKWDNPFGEEEQDVK